MSMVVDIGIQGLSNSIYTKFIDNIIKEIVVLGLVNVNFFPTYLYCCTTLTIIRSLQENY